MKCKSKKGDDSLILLSHRLASLYYSKCIFYIILDYYIENKEIKNGKFQDE